MNIITALLILSIIVIIHELGHFLLAKKNGITVTEFSVGMGPRIASFVRNGTRYSLKLFPIGGSCMMLGEDDAVEDAGAFNNKDPWARFSVLFAGPFFNFILAFVLALVLLGVKGVDLPVINKVEAGSVVDQAKIQQGDRVTSINGAPIHLAREVVMYSYFTPYTKEPVKVKYIRDKKEYETEVIPKFVEIYLLGCDFDLSVKNAVKLEKITKHYPLAQAGLKAGDVIVNINGIDINSLADMNQYLKNYPMTKETISLTYLQGGGKGSERTIEITPKLALKGYEIDWNINRVAKKIPSISVMKYSFYELKYNIVNTIKSLRALFTGEISVNDLSGPLGIVNYVGDVVSKAKSDGFGIMLANLVNFCILLSANLGVMNLLPLPALDGGRLVFVLIEVVRGKPVSREKEVIVHLAGMAVLMLLMVFVFYNDIRNIIG
jgi:regulator of sigma E protease